MKIVGTIVDDSMKLSGCVLRGTPEELNVCSTEGKITVEYSIRDVKRVISDVGCSNFKLNRAGDFVPKGFQKLSDLPMYDLRGRKVSNEIQIKAIIEKNGILVGASILYPEKEIVAQLKLDMLFYVYSYCKASNFVLKEKDGIPYITGKNGIKKEDIPVLSDFLSENSKSMRKIVIPTDMDMILSNAFDGCESLKNKGGY